MKIGWKFEPQKNRERNFGKSVGTWSERLEAAWDLAKPFIQNPAKPMRVADYGCGRQELRALLPANYCYQPFDYLERSPDTVICDFNRQLPSGDFDVIFCLGVFEYLDNPVRLLRHALAHGERVVFSHFHGWNPWRAWSQGWRGRLTLNQVMAALKQEDRSKLAYQRWRQDGAIWVCGRGDA